MKLPTCAWVVVCIHRDGSSFIVDAYGTKTGAKIKAAAWRGEKEGVGKKFKVVKYVLEKQ